MNLQLHDQQHQPSNVNVYPLQQPKPQPTSPLQMYLNSNVPPPGALPTFNNENSLNHQQSSLPNNPVSSLTTAAPLLPATAQPTTAINASNKIHPSNDMNDAFNISKILQSSISNGTGGNSSISTNNNSLSSTSNDKKAQDSLKFNSKSEETSKDSKQSRQAKNKKEQKATENRSDSPLPTCNSIVQPKQVVLRNGDVKARRKVVYNHQNGEDYAHSEEQLKKWEKSNQETKMLVYKEIKKFGRDYSGLFIQLEKIKGHAELQHLLIKDFITQCLRYKRQTMAKSIEEWWEKRHVCKNGNGKKHGDPTTGKLKI